MKLIAESRHDEAEPLLRQCLEIRQGLLSADHWLIFNTMSVLDGALGGQKRIGETEPLLIESYQAMKPPPAASIRKQQALERIVKLYEAWGKPDQAAEWRTTLPTTQPATQSAPSNDDVRTKPEEH